MNNRTPKTRGKYIAVSILFVVACSFSYCAGMQQNGEIGKLFANPVTNYNENTNINTTQTSLDNNPGQQESPSNVQSEENTGVYYGRFGHHGRHGYYHGNFGYNGGGPAQQSDQLSQQQFDATPQRCCATGKTGTCHS